MLFHSRILLCLPLLPCLISAVSVTVPKPDRVVKRAPTCTPASAGDPTIDDVPAILEAIQECGDGGVIVIPEDTEYIMASRIVFDGCIDCDFQLEGTLTASEDLSYWNTTREMILFDKVAGGKFRSLTGKGVIDGKGQVSYDWFGEHGNIQRPVLFSIGGSSDITLSGIKMVNPHVAFVYVGHGSERIDISDLDMSAVSESEYGPRNTDGFDIAEASHVTLTNIKVVNQDDCVAFKPGCDYVSVQNIECDGSHGLSVGSLAKYPGSVDSVTNVWVKGARMINSSKAIGIKIYPGGPNYGTAVVRNMTWEDIYVENCDSTFQSEACYEPPNKDRSYCEANPSASEITDVFVRNLTGTTNDRYGGTTGYVYCPVEGENCQIHIEDFEVTSAVSPSEFLCDKIDPDVLGIDCVPTDPY
ncbi:pectin lyase fold/virulence factor [Aspergillus insuetus]